MAEKLTASQVEALKRIQFLEGSPYRVRDVTAAMRLLEAKGLVAINDGSQEFLVVTLTDAGKDTLKHYYPAGVRGA